MEPVTVSVSIDRPREEVFDYLSDIANHQEFSDHYLVDWHMTRVETQGRGAGARFRFTARGNRFDYADVTFVEMDRPRRIVMAGRGGKFNRTRLRSIYELAAGSGRTTKVSLTVETRPGNLGDRLMESLGFRGWLKRGSSKALKRLRSILEDGEGRGARATIAGL